MLQTIEDKMFDSFSVYLSVAALFLFCCLIIITVLAYILIGDDQ